MKRFALCATLLLAATLGLSAQTKLVLTIWGGRGDFDAMTRMLEAAKPAIADLNVEVMLLADYDKTVTTRIVGNQQVDVMWIAESVHEFSGRNQLADLGPLAKKAGLDLNDRFGIAATRYAKDGKTFALPLRGGPMVVYVNKDLVKQKPQVTWTYDDFVSAAKAAYRPAAKKADTVWGFVPAGNGTWWPWYTSFIYAAGGSLLDAKGKPNFADPKTVQGLRNYAAFMGQYKISPTLGDMADIGQSSPDPVFNSGKAGMIMTGWWNVSSLKDATFNWDVAAIPNDKGRGTVIFGQGLAIPSTCRNKDAAFRVVAALTDVAAQQRMVDILWDIPANVKVLNSDGFTKAPWSKSPLDMKAVADAITKGAIDLPYTAKWGKMHDTIGNVVNELLKGNVTPEAAAARIQKDLSEQVFNR